MSADSQKKNNIPQSIDDITMRRLERVFQRLSKLENGNESENKLCMDLESVLVSDSYDLNLLDRLDVIENILLDPAEDEHYLFVTESIFSRKHDFDYWKRCGCSERESRIYAKIGEMIEGDEQELEEARDCQGILGNECLKISMEERLDILEEHIAAFYKARKERKDHVINSRNSEKEEAGETVEKVGVTFRIVREEAIVEHGSYYRGAILAVPVAVNKKPVRKIENNAFWCKKSLERVILPSTVLYVGEKAFEGCRRLTSIVIPEGVTSIGRNAFSDCSLLESIVLPNSLTELGSGAFMGCNNLNSVILSNGMTDIKDSSFSGCKKLKAITIPEGVTRIGENAFWGCSDLEEVSLPDSLNTIERFAFEGCSKLKNIHFPDGLSWVGYRAFRDCSALKEVTVPSTLRIGTQAFKGIHVIRKEPQE